jgi:hypothetical protein
LTIEGQRLYAPAPSLRADISDGRGDTGFQASRLTFASDGCWEIICRAGNVESAFVTLVVGAGK